MRAAKLRQDSGGSVTLDELIGMLGDIRDRAAASGPPVAMEVARVYSAHLSHVTLRQSYASPGQFGTPAAPLAPPAYRTGALAASVFPWPGPSSGFAGNAYAGPHVIYGRTQETGAIHEARNFRFMHWSNDGGQLWHLGAGSRRGNPGVRVLHSPWRRVVEEARAYPAQALRRACPVRGGR